MTSSSRHYDRFDKLCGVSGQAGNLRGKMVAGGNPFEGPRGDELSQQADQDRRRQPAMFGTAAQKPRLSSVPGAVGDIERALCES